MRQSAEDEKTNKHEPPILKSTYDKKCAAFTVFFVTRVCHYPYGHIFKLRPEGCEKCAWAAML